MGFWGGKLIESWRNGILHKRIRFAVVGWRCGIQCECHNMTLTLNAASPILFEWFNNISLFQKRSEHTYFVHVLCPTKVDSRTGHDRKLCTKKISYDLFISEVKIFWQLLRRFVLEIRHILKIFNFHVVWHENSDSEVIKYWQRMKTVCVVWRGYSNHIDIAVE